MGMQRVTALASGAIALIACVGWFCAADAGAVATPSPGTVQIFAETIHGQFNGHRPPRAVAVSLPASSQPAGLAILAQARRTKIARHSATYVLLVEVFCPLGGGAISSSWSGSLTASFTGVLQRPAPGRTIVLGDAFGASVKALAAFQSSVNRLAGPVTLKGLSQPATIDDGALGWSATQLGALTSFWQGFSGTKIAGKASVAALYAALNAGLPGLFTAPASKGSTTPTPGMPEVFGSSLATDPTTVAQGGVDWVVWQSSTPAGSGAVTISGQVTSVSLRGFYAGGTCTSLCEDNMHFQDLRPAANGQLQVISTTQSFTLPTTLGTYTFQPIEFFVKAGDFIGLSVPGGSFQVLSPASGDEIGMFTGQGLDMNGDSLASNGSQSGYELDIQETIKPSS